ncbi:hypothetical protein N4G62_07620 [Sphingomonas sanguinis]|uniref:Uncharacterized protein n=1 Tax=Sphingomonas sanguinis TaxID=33051 RepID=A0ABU5LPM9_9SPHN|nr:hypothetical protein [Sphingomonas sanguinis]MDZ7281894.1 hypothetical protein [Sphingomonas sanguinis]
MILFAVLLQTGAALSFGDARRLPPTVAGERLLKGVQHGPIEAFVAPVGGMNAPGVIDANLVERPIATTQGCTRIRWTVRFRADPDDALDHAIPDDRYPMTEIAPSKASGCPTADYVHLNPGVTLSQGFDILEQLDRLRSGEAKFAIQCADQTHSGLCDSEATIPAKLSRLKPWNISADPNGFLIWLGTPGQTVNEVRFDSRQPDHAWVGRYYPAPF